MVPDGQRAGVVPHVVRLVELARVEQIVRRSERAPSPSSGVHRGCGGRGSDGVVAPDNDPLTPRVSPARPCRIPPRRLDTPSVHVMARPSETPCAPTGQEQEECTLVRIIHALGRHVRNTCRA